MAINYEGGLKMNTKTILEKARELMRRGWCKYASARTRDGLETYPSDQHAVSFCASGACERVVSDQHYSSTKTFPASVDYNAAMMFLCGALRTNSIPEWNDDPDRTKAQVLVAFDRAIADLSDVPDVVPDEILQEAVV